MNPERSLIPRRPLLMLAAAMIFTVPAMFGNLVWWVPSGFLSTLLFRFLLEWKGTRLRSTFLKVLLMAAGIGAVALNYHSLIGPEPGMSICLALIGVKILEAHSARDFHVLAALGWFASMAQLIISQSLAISVCSGIAFAIVLAAVLLFHCHSHASGAFLRALRAAGIMMLQATPIILVLFFCFPRGSGRMGLFLHGSFGGQSGMSDTLAPGTVASLALSNKVAFRATFPDGNMPIPTRMYWRGAILTTGSGMTWKISKIDQQEQPAEAIEGKPVHQRIVLQPHGARWIFALDKPAQAPKGMLMGAGNILLSKKPISSTLQYDVLSLPNSRAEELSLLQRRRYLQLNSVSSSVWNLAQSWRQNAAPPSAIVEKGLEFFRKGRFRYTLTPGEYGVEGMDEFLFHRRIGFCEHFAAAFTTLMRAAGIPTRIVIGYVGGEYNTLGRYLIVRQSNAHAWCEVWMADTGWKRVDPTAMVAPAGFDSLDSPLPGTDSSALARAFRTRGILHSLILAWDSINYEWDTRVAGFDEDSQQDLFIEHGLVSSTPITLLGASLILGAALMALQGLVSWLKSRPKRDPLVVLYDRFCRRAASLGAKREPCEGPEQFTRRAAQLIPSQSKRIQRIAELYIQLRYSPHPDRVSKSDLAREIQRFGRERN